MGFWAIAAPLIGTVASAVIGDKGAKAQAKAATTASDRAENARQQAMQATSHGAIHGSAQNYFQGLLAEKPAYETWGGKVRSSVAPGQAGGPITVLRNSDPGIHNPDYVRPYSPYGEHLGNPGNQGLNPQYADNPGGDDSHFGLQQGGAPNPYGTGQIDGANLPRPRAQGGPVETGEDYIVGEEGPELMIPEQDGTIIPNPSTVASGGQGPMGPGGPPMGDPGMQGGGMPPGGAPPQLPPEMIEAIVPLILAVMQQVLGGGGQQGPPGALPPGGGEMGALPPAPPGGGAPPPMMPPGGGMPGGEMGMPPGGGMGMPPGGMDQGMMPPQAGAPGFAQGGPVQAGQPVTVGEQGPEQFQPGGPQPVPGGRQQPTAQTLPGIWQQPPGFGMPTQTVALAPPGREAQPPGPQARVEAPPGPGQGLGGTLVGNMQQRAENPGQLSSTTYERQQEQANMNQNVGAQELAGGLTQSGVDPSSPAGQAMLLANTLASNRQRSDAARDYGLAEEQLARQDEQQAWTQYMQALQTLFGFGQSQAAAAGGTAFPQVAPVNPYGNLASGVANAGNLLGNYFGNRPGSPGPPGWNGTNYNDPGFGDYGESPRD